MASALIQTHNGRTRRIGAGEEPSISISMDVSMRQVLHRFKGAKLHVLLCLALHANELGWAYPSYATIAEETGYQEDAIKAAVKDLATMELDGARVMLSVSMVPDSRNKWQNPWYLIFPSASDCQEWDAFSPYQDNPMRAIPTWNLDPRDRQPMRQNTGVENTPPESANFERVPGGQNTIRGGENTPLKVKVLTNISNDILVGENEINEPSIENNAKPKRGRKPAPPRDPSIPNARDVLKMLESDCGARITAWGADGKNAKVILDAYGATQETMDRIKRCYAYLTRHSRYGKDPISLGLVNKFMQRWLDLGEPYDEAAAAEAYAKQQAAQKAAQMDAPRPPTEKERRERIQRIIDLQGLDYAISIGLVPASAKQEQKGV